MVQGARELNPPMPTVYPTPPRNLTLSVLGCFAQAMKNGNCVNGGAKSQEYTAGRNLLPSRLCTRVMFLHINAQRCPPPNSMGLQYTTKFLSFRF